MFVVNVTYILCLYKKDVLRGDFRPLQKWPKGVNTEMWNVMWGKRRTDGGDGEDDEGTSMVNVALTVTL